MKIENMMDLLVNTTWKIAVQNDRGDWETLHDYGTQDFTDYDVILDWTDALNLTVKDITADFNGNVILRVRERLDDVPTRPY